MKLRNFFREEKQYHLFLLLGLTTIFSLALVGYRMYYLQIDRLALSSLDKIVYGRGKTYLFLVWNLFLAWVPYGIALSIRWIDHRYKSKIISGLTLFTWLLFFPNAPYIITDFLHLGYRTSIPEWYDLILIFSFAWTGLILGYLSLREVQLFLQKRLGSTIGWMFSFTAILLCGFGVYLGRYLRWNSWDIIANPIELLTDIFFLLSQPAANKSAVGMTVMLTGVLALGYLTLITLYKETKQS